MNNPEIDLAHLSKKQKEWLCLGGMAVTALLFVTSVFRSGTEGEGKSRLNNDNREPASVPSVVLDNPELMTPTNFYTPAFPTATSADVMPDLGKDRRDPATSTTTVVTRQPVTPAHGE